MKSASDDVTAGSGKREARCRRAYIDGGEWEEGEIRNEIPAARRFSFEPAGGIHKIAQPHPPSVMKHFLPAVFPALAFAFAAGSAAASPWPVR